MPSWGVADSWSVWTEARRGKEPSRCVSGGGQTAGEPSWAGGGALGCPVALCRWRSLRRGLDGVGAGAPAGAALGK